MKTHHNRLCFKVESSYAQSLMSYKHIQTVNITAGNSATKCLFSTHTRTKNNTLITGPCYINLLMITETSALNNRLSTLLFSVLGYGSCGMMQTNSFNHSITGSVVECGTTKQCANKQTHGQSSHRLVNSPTASFY